MAGERAVHFQDAMPMVMESDLATTQDGEVDGLENGNDFEANAPLKEQRVIRKAKRLTTMSPRKDEGSENGVVPGHVIHSTMRIPPFSKNSRKSRQGRGRGLPKKGGGGGKGVWGKLGSELGEPEGCIDSNDPNYDSDSQDAQVLLRPVAPELTQEELNKVIDPIILEYLEHGDTEEVVDLLQNLNMGIHKWRVVVLAVMLALERHDPQRELTSRLISDLYGPVLSMDDMIRGFDGLVAELDDLTLDTPEAPKFLGQFIARAVADDCLPPKYVSNYKGNVERSNALLALEKADILLSLKHGMLRLDNVWGVGGGNRPVRLLTKRICALLKEYLNSGDITEAVRCLRELDVPHFHHELVYQSIALAIEDTSEGASELMARLLTSLTSINVITPEEYQKGMLRLYSDMPDICVDVPIAYILLDRLANKLSDAGLLEGILSKELPSRGRKRFVSEGDGGRIKENNNLSLCS